MVINLKKKNTEIHSVEEAAKIEQPQSSRGLWRGLGEEVQSREEEVGGEGSNNKSSAASGELSVCTYWDDFVRVVIEILELSRPAYFLLD